MTARAFRLLYLSCCALIINSSFSMSHRIKHGAGWDLSLEPLRFLREKLTCGVHW